MFFGWQFLVQNYFDLLALLVAKHLNLVFLHTHILPNILFTYHTTWHRHRPCKGHLSVGSPLVVSDKNPKRITYKNPCISLNKEEHFCFFLGSYAIREGSGLDGFEDVSGLVLVIKP